VPRQIFAHGWWTVNGEKMSKSKGNVVDPFQMVDTYGADAFRYFLLREVPFGLDGDFSERAFRQRYNGDLANDLGNLCFRTFSMIDRYAGGRIPPRTSGAKSKEDEQLHKAAAALAGKIGAAMGELAFHRALQAIWEVVEPANRYIEITAPWNLDKQKKKQRLSTVLYNLAEALHLISLYLYPFMPQTAERIQIQLGMKPSFETLRLAKSARVGALRPGLTMRKSEVLFPRLELLPGEVEPARPGRPQPGAGRGKPATQTGKPAQPRPAGQQKPKERPPAQPAAEEKPKAKEAAAKAQPAARQPGGARRPEGQGQAPGQVTAGDFSRMELRVARILAAERIPNSNKLLKLRVSLGTEERQVVAGIGTKYEPDQLIGKQVVVLANLRPAKLMGVESQGMILAAGEQTVASLLTLLEEVPEGTKIK
jgi:methionyl-tRNA synthetase